MHVPYSVGLDDDVAVVMTSTLVITTVMNEKTSHQQSWVDDDNQTQT